MLSLNILTFPHVQLLPPRDLFPHPVNSTESTKLKIPTLSQHGHAIWDEFELYVMSIQGHMLYMHVAELNTQSKILYIDKYCLALYIEVMIIILMGHHLFLFFQ